MKVNAFRKAHVRASFTMPSDDDSSLYPVYSGYIIVSSNATGENVTVPYAGVDNKLATMPVWTRSGSLPTGIYGIVGTSGVSVMTPGEDVSTSVGLAINKRKFIFVLLFSEKHSNQQFEFPTVIQRLPCPPLTIKLKYTTKEVTRPRPTP